MNITLNGNSTTIESQSTIAQLLEKIELNNHPVAVEVNQQIIKRSLHSAHFLAPDDRVEIVQAIGGG